MWPKFWLMIPHTSTLLLPIKCCHFIYNFIIFWYILNYIYIYIYHHHVVLPAQISLTLSCPLSLSSIAPRMSSRIYPVSVKSCSSWSSCLCSPMWRGPQEYVTYKFVITSPAVSHMSCSSNLDSFCDGW